MKIEIRVPASSIRTMMSNRNPVVQPCKSGRTYLLDMCERTNPRHITADDLNRALGKLRLPEAEMVYSRWSGSNDWFIVHAIVPYAPDAERKTLCDLSHDAYPGGEFHDVCAVYDIVFYERK